MDSNDYIQLSGELLRSCRAGYYGNISFIDAQLGRLFSGKVPANTYVIFTSDHGEMLGDHYRYHKCTGYEGSARIPFLISGPEIDACTVRDEPVGWHDILPTVLDYAEVACPEAIDGRSVRPLLSDGGVRHNSKAGPESRSEVPWRTHLTGECLWHTVNDLPGQMKEGNTYYDAGHHFATDGKRKFIWHPKSGTEQFFNLEDDPDERYNLASDPARAGEIAVWRQRLIAALADRPEGFVKDGALRAGAQMQTLMPDALALREQRIAEGHDILYYTPPKRLS
jgi:arylsulfatase A-like enzyme